MTQRSIDSLFCWGRSVSVFTAATLLAVMPATGQQDTGQIDTIVRSGAIQFPEDLTIRARLKAITPSEPSVIRWRYGGEGQGGEVIRGIFAKADVPEDASEESHTLEVGEWSSPLKVASLAKRFPKKLFLTVTAGNPGSVVDRITRERGGYSTGVVFEFEVAHRDRVIKTIVVEGPDGGTATLVIPAYRLTGSTKPDSPLFLSELTGVLEYATRRAESLEALPWADWPLPKKYAIVNNVGGYGCGFGYGIRTTDKRVTLAEMRALRQLGVNGFRDPPEYLLEAMERKAPEAQAWRRAMITGVMGFPAPRFREGRPADPEAGCPFGENVPSRTSEMVQESLRSILALPVDEVWGLTVDEIGTVIDQSPEKKAHLSVCPRCIRAFQVWLEAKGLKPSDFGASEWSEVRPLNVWSDQPNPPWLSDPGQALAAYYTRDFNNYATAKLFTRLRDTFAEADTAESAPSSAAERRPAGRLPRVYSYALRGNTFLMKGHSLDFFDFYRWADNAVVYETSNREPRIWGWDSYLCDVQRVLGREMGLAQGIYIKPHRGAPVERMLAAVSRGNTMLYWYTYGPDYKKGDSFSQDPEALRLVSKAAHLLGRAEEALYGSRWAIRPEIAVVKPETTQRWMNLAGNPPHLTAAWENAKWVYAALQHAHLPVDPIDEQMLAEEDLSHYKMIYVSGTHITRHAAMGLRRYVQQGGTLCTSGWGLARDEANRPMDTLQPVLGLTDRREPEMWYRVELYGATSLEPYDDPRRSLAPVPVGAKIVGGDLVPGSFAPRIGREVLQPSAEAEILARFADGSAAVTRHAFGRGQAYVAGFFPGLEYSAPLRRADYDMRRDFDAVRRHFIAAAAAPLVEPAVDASDPLVEGVLLKNEQNGSRAVTLANWAYGVTRFEQDASGRQRAVVTHLPIEDLSITIRGAGEVRQVRSCMLDRPLDFSVSLGDVIIRLPRLEEGDVLLLH